VIRLRYSTQKKPKRLGKVTLAPGERVCRVYATEGVEELVRWGVGAGLLSNWIHTRPLPHFLVWGERLDLYCQAALGVEVATDEIWERDIAAWRRVADRARDFALALE
jgi:hypothetical protein